MFDLVKNSQIFIWLYIRRHYIEWSWNWASLIWKFKNAKCSKIWNVLSSNMMPTSEKSHTMYHCFTHKITENPTQNILQFMCIMHKWNQKLWLSLGSTSKIPNYAYANIPRPGNKTWNLKYFSSQIFQKRDTQLAHAEVTLHTNIKGEDGRTYRIHKKVRNPEVLGTTLKELLLYSLNITHDKMVPL